jgi:hypothetical protein
MATKNGNKKTENRAAVYIPFKTFITAIDTLKPGIPPEIDRTVWPTFSGGLQSQTLGAFKFLGLIEEDGIVKPILNSLVNANDDERKEILGQIINEKYLGAVQLAESNASYGALEEYFRSYTTKGTTLYRIIRFFLDACEYTGQKGSTHWAKARKTVGRRLRKADTGSDKEKLPPRNHLEQPKANVKVVTLKNGAGTVSLSLTVDLTKLDMEDWEWVRGLLEKMSTYGQSKGEQE